MHWQGQFFGGVGLGALSVGQKIVAQLSWTSHTLNFVASWTDAVTGKNDPGVLPDTMPDTTPPAAPDKLIGVSIIPLNFSAPKMASPD